MGTDIATIPGGFATATLDERMRYAAALASSGELLPKSLWETVKVDGLNVQRPSKGKVLLLTETGIMLGIHPVAALNGVNIIEGKPTISPGLMSSLIRKAGHTLRVTVSGTIEGGDLAATADLIRADDPDFTFTATWTLHDAHRAELCTYTQQPNGQWKVVSLSRNGNPQPWQKYPRAMLKARVISEVGREGAEDALMGVHYTPEELGANVSESGEPLDLGDLKPAPQPEAAQRPAETSAAPATAENAQRAENARETAAQPQSEPIVTQPKAQGTPGARDWVAEADLTENADELGILYQAARAAGALGQTVTIDGKPMQLRAYLTDMGNAFRLQEEQRAAQAAAGGDVVDATVEPDERPAIFDNTLTADPETGIITNAAGEIVDEHGEQTR